MPDYRAEARRAAQRHGLDPDVFSRQIQQESGFNPHARSPAGAQGIAQIMPATAKGWGVNPSDPIASLDAAAKNMRRYVDQYGSYKNALVAYNAGPGRVGGPLPAETQNYIKTILGGSNPSSSSRNRGGGAAGSQRYRSTTTTTPGVDNSAARAQLVSAFLEDKNADPVNFALQGRALQDVAPTSSTTRQRLGDSMTDSIGGGGGATATASAARRAGVIDKQRLPYSWGGGHAGQTKIHDPVPLDCSGAVSKVLGIDPRVADQFKSWGRPGDGGNRGITVYSKPTHVLMKINGHFFGTSGSNPGGGAGWIEQTAISPEYLRGFTARHSNR